MTDTESNDFDVSDAALERAGVFGYDETGSKHMFDPVRGQVIVCGGDDVDHVEQLDREAVSRWLAYVKDRRGWLDQWWDVKDPAEAARRHRHAEAQAADERYEQAKEASA